MTSRSEELVARFFDPRWHFVRDAFDRLYREIELDGSVVSLGIFVGHPDGLLVNYLVTAAEPGKVHRIVVTDVDELVRNYQDSLGSGAFVDATVPDEEPT